MTNDMEKCYINCKDEIVIDDDKDDLVTWIHKYCKKKTLKITLSSM